MPSQYSAYDEQQSSDKLQYDQQDNYEMDEEDAFWNGGDVGQVNNRAGLNQVADTGSLWVMTQN